VSVGTQGWIRIEPVRGWHIEVAEEQPLARQFLSKGYESLCGIRSGVCLAAGQVRAADPHWSRGGLDLGKYD